MNMFKNLKMLTKIMGLVGVLLLLMAISSGFGIIKIGHIGNEFKGVAGRDIPLSQDITGITLDQLGEAVWLERAFRFGQVLADKQTSADGLQLAENKFDTFTKEVSAWKEKAKELTQHAVATAQSEDARREFKKVDAQLDKVGEQYQNYENYAQQAFALINQGKLHDSEQLSKKIETSEKAFDNELDKFVNQVQGFTDKASQRAESDERIALKGMMGMTIGALIVGLVLGFFISRGISVPTRKAVAFAEAISDGDLTRQLDIEQKDEIGMLARALNKMGANLREMFKNISGGVETISSSSTELSAISEQMTQGITDVSDKSNTVSAAAEEMSANMNNVAAAMEQSATNTNMVATASEEMSSTIGEIAQNAERARGISGEAAKKSSSASTNMDELGTAAKSIGAVIEVITDISEQVNLLALNATIEAARAGEAGKGFAVVANEIKELAKQTASATQDIKEKIEGIQKTTDVTVGQIAEITQVITEVNDVVTNIATAVEEQSVVTKDIASNVAQASTGIQEVNENVNQSSAVSAEISQSVAGVSASMNEMATGSSQLNQSAQELSQLSENLKKMMDQFTV